VAQGVAAADRQRCSAIPAQRNAPATPPPTRVRIPRRARDVRLVQVCSTRAHRSGWARAPEPVTVDGRTGPDSGIVHGRIGSPHRSWSPPLRLTRSGGAPRQAPTCRLVPCSFATLRKGQRTSTWRKWRTRSRAPKSCTSPSVASAPTAEREDLVRSGGTELAGALLSTPTAAASPTVSRSAPRAYARSTSPSFSRAPRRAQPGSRRPTHSQNLYAPRASSCCTVLSR